MAKYDYKITLKKFAINSVIVIVAGVAAVYADNPYYLALAPLIKAFENYIKNK